MEIDLQTQMPTQQKISQALYSNAELIHRMVMCHNNIMLCFRGPESAVCFLATMDQLCRRSAWPVAGAADHRQFAERARMLIVCTWLCVAAAANHVTSPSVRPSVRHSLARLSPPAQRPLSALYSSEQIIVNYNISPIALYLSAVEVKTLILQLVFMDSFILSVLSIGQSFNTIFNYVCTFIINTYLILVMAT